MLQRCRNYCSLFSSLLNFYSDERTNFFNNIRNIDENSLHRSDSRISEMLLFGISYFNDTKKKSVLNTTIESILSTKKFDVSLISF